MQLGLNSNEKDFINYYSLFSSDAGPGEFCRSDRYVAQTARLEIRHRVPPRPDCRSPRPEPPQGLPLYQGCHRRV